jgi:4-hydroxybenzoate polyprenyltransferase
MKRFMGWPQLVLGLTFKWGALMGWAVTFGRLDWAPLVLYLGCIAWTLGYDTIYAHQDKEDDALVGLKSTALTLGGATHRWLAGFYAMAWLCLTGAGLMSGAGVVFVMAMSVAGLQLVWQVATLETADPASCLARFRANHAFGAIVFAGLVADMALRAHLH